MPADSLRSPDLRPQISETLLIAGMAVIRWFLLLANGVKTAAGLAPSLPSASVRLLQVRMVTSKPFIQSVHVHRIASIYLFAQQGEREGLVGSHLFYSQPRVTLLTTRGYP